MSNDPLRNIFDGPAGPIGGLGVYLRLTRTTKVPVSSLQATPRPSLTSRLRRWFGRN
jgi:hypothetical protein